MTAAPPEAYAAALAALPGMGPKALSTLLERWSPPEAWARVGKGRAEGHERWSRAAAATDVGALWRAYAEQGVAVRLLGHDGYPPVLAADHQAPAVLFARGDLGALEHPRVAIVGTRRCSHSGREVARTFGHDLASEGVAVVSGLALGIDGAAHAGALSAAVAPPIGVVGSGLDVVYPHRHAELWQRVATVGVLLGEAPLGARPEAWRFPARNRIIAALANVVVVVESHAKGGSRHTVEEAMARDRTVMVVPGSVRNPASAYTNALLSEGATPACDPLDVLVALGLSTAGRSPSRGDRHRPPVGDDVVVLEAVGWEAATLEQIVARCGHDPATVAVSLAHLERNRWIVSGPGWWERVARP